MVPIYGLLMLDKTTDILHKQLERVLTWKFAPPVFLKLTSGVYNTISKDIAWIMFICEELC